MRTSGGARLAFIFLLLLLPTVSWGFQPSNDYHFDRPSSRVKAFRHPPLSRLNLSSELNDRNAESVESRGKRVDDTLMKKTNPWQLSNNARRKIPPMQVEDMDLLFYDMFLIINLVMASSFWVVHRLQFEYLGLAFSEGCLLCLLWIASGLYYGAFLDSAVDGHYGSADERGGPKAALLLGFQTYIGTINLRLLFALVTGFIQHRTVGATGGEDLLPFEISFGIILMSGWRALHSSTAPRFK